MNEIIRHIEFLLVSNDCVVIPALGAVIAHDIPARFDHSQHILMPPSRSFSFNSSLTHNDGLLISSVARSKSISFEASRNLVAGEVESMKRVLAEARSLSLGMVGTLKSAENGVYTFTPGSKASSLSPKYFWLQDLKCSPITELARRQARSEELAAESTRRRVSPVNYLYHVFRVAASFALLLALGFVLTTPIAFDKAQYASLGLENFSVEQPEKPVQASQLIRRPGESTGVVKLYLREFEDAIISVDTAEHAAYIRERQLAKTDVLTQQDDNLGSALRLNDNDRYFLIVASLPTEIEAREYIENSNNQQLGILAKDGRYRVYVATGSNLREAQTAAATLSDRYPDVWVCRK